MNNLKIILENDIASILSSVNLLLQSQCIMYKQWLEDHPIIVREVKIVARSVRATNIEIEQLIYKEFLNYLKSKEV